MVASDSSRVYREMRASLLFAVQAVAVGSKSGVETVLTDAEADHCVVPAESGKTPVEEVVRRVAQFASRELELTVASRLVSGDEEVLHDGSLFSFLWYGKFPAIPEEFKFARRQRPRTLRDLWRSVASSLLEARRRALLLFVTETIRRNYYVEKLVPRELAPTSALNDLVLLELLRSTLRRLNEEVVKVATENRLPYSEAVKRIYAEERKRKGLGQAETPEEMYRELLKKYVEEAGRNSGERGLPTF